MKRPKVWPRLTLVTTLAPASSCETSVSLMYAGATNLPSPVLNRSFSWPLMRNQPLLSMLPLSLARSKPLAVMVSAVFLDSLWSSYKWLEASENVVLQWVEKNRVWER